jgi:hypothetical protein
MPEADALIQLISISQRPIFNQAALNRAIDCKKLKAFGKIISYNR